MPLLQTTWMLKCNRARKLRAHTRMCFTFCLFNPLSPTLLMSSASLDDVESLCIP
eukprot:m.258143 g.258143  ORF g.258143 m.258143 type:complete len:55 (+) comp11033_c1_seq24:3351-3515(+)